LVLKDRTATEETEGEEIGRLILTLKLRLHQVECQEGLMKKSLKSHATFRKWSACGIDTSMISFREWVRHGNLLGLLRLLENAQFFRPEDYNGVFENELGKLLTRIHDPAVRQQVSKLRGFDWGSYISRSLARAGFRGDDIQENFHSLVMKLLLSPGKLFKGWSPERHGPLERRFRAATWNAIRNVVEKRRNYQRWMVSADPAVMAGIHPAREHPHSTGLLDDFRKVVAEKLGKLAAAILDWRLEGKQTKEMIGRAEFDSPSIYSIKREVGEIKKLAHRFAAKSGDPEFLAKVEKALSNEAATVAKRQAATQR
jgi:hypothetical protein